MWTQPTWLFVSCLSACLCLQIIMELQCGGEAEAVDLSGDAGVVGRWLVQGDEDNPQLCMDLKGVLFSATTVRPSHCSPLWCSAPVPVHSTSPRMWSLPSICAAMPASEGVS